MAKDFNLGDSPAFPKPAFRDSQATYSDSFTHGDADGMNIRTYAAIMALNGILACPAADLPEHAMYPDGAARYAVEMADYLLSELEKPQSSPT